MVSSASPRLCAFATAFVRMSQSAISLPVLPAKKRGAWDHARPWLLRLYRMAVVVAIAWLIHRQHVRLRVDGDAPIGIGEVKKVLPAAATLSPDESERGGLLVYGAKGETVGYVVRTSPAADKITGYAGPTDTLVALDAAGKVAGIRVRSSWDTKEHVRDVVENEYFMSLWNGKTWEQVAAQGPQEAGVEGVSGASLTSMAIANGIHHRFKSAAQQAKLPPVRVGAHDVGLVLVLIVALVFSFTDLRGKTWARRLFQVVLIGYVGFWNGQLLAQSLFGGWAATTPAWRMAPGLVLLAAAAFIVPWASRRAVYCSQICPHGAAQELIGRLSKKKLRLNGGMERGLRWLPPGLVLVVIVVLMLNLPLDLARIEPFDAYLIRAAGLATIVIAVVGLIAAAFVPMAYCKYGCPTGLVLQYVRSHGKADSFGRRDWVAGLLVLAAAGMYLRYDAIHRWIYG